MRKNILCVVLSGLLAIAPLRAQGTDTTIVKPVAGGFMIDFVNVNVRVVIDALMDAGGLQYTTARLPANQMGTLKVGPVTKAEIAGVLKAFVEGQNLQMVPNADTTFWTISPPPPAARGGGAAPAGNPDERGLYTIQIRNQSNIDLAQIITAVFAPSTGRGGQVLNLQNQGARGQNQAGRGGAAGAAGGRGGGGGGGGRGGGGGGGGGDEDPLPLTTAQNQSSLNPGSALVSLNPIYDQAVIQDRVAAREQVQVDRVVNAIQQGANVPNLAQILGGAAGAQIQAALQGQPGAAGQQAQPVIIPMTGTNQLIVRATAAEFALIQALVGAVDLRPLQVLIEVSIVEVRRSEDLDFGISGSGTFTKRGDTEPRATGTLLGPTSFDTARDFVLQLAGGRGTVDFNVALHALSTRGDVKVVSLPIIFAQNNLQAQLIVGEQRPFVSTTQVTDVGSVSSIVQYRDVSTVLLITPTINADGYVNMDVNQQVQDITNEVAFDAPVISTRQAITSLFVKSGQTAVIGGLASTRSEKTRSGIPFLAKLPIIGALFGSTRNSDVVTELYLFLTPHVVETDQDTDYIREAVKNQSDVFKTFPLRQIIQVPQPDTTIRVIIPRDTGSVTRIPRIPPDTGRRVPPGRDTLGVVPPATATHFHNQSQSYMGLLSR